MLFTNKNPYGIKHWQFYAFKKQDIANAVLEF